MAISTRNSALFGAILTSMATASVTFWLTTRDSNEEVCDARDCINAAARVLNAMDMTADPCNSFYQYACGGWFDENPLSDNNSAVSQFTLLDKSNEKKLQAILSSNFSDGREAVRKAKIFYRSCMNEEALEKLGAKPALDMVEKYGGMPLFEGISKVTRFDLEKYLPRSMNRYQQYFDRISSPLVGVRVAADDMNSSKNVIILDQPNLVMPTRDYYINGRLNASIRVYRRYMHDYLAELWKSKEKGKDNESNYDELSLRKSVAEIVQLEVDLAKILEPEENRLDIFVLYNKLSIQEMSEKISPEFNWFQFLKGTMGRVGYAVKADTEVVIYGMPYFKKLTSVLEKYEKRIIKNYIIWYNLNQHINLLSRKFRDTQASYRRVITGTSDEEPRWKTCIKITNSLLPMPVGALFVQTFFSKDSKEMVDVMTTNILQFFKNELASNTWMDEETKQAAMVKVDAMKRLVAYPDYILDEDNKKLDRDHKNLIVTEENYFENAHELFIFNMKRTFIKIKERAIREEFNIGPAVVNAFYQENLNRIAFPAAILQTPFFELGRPHAMNYGAIGHAFAHELTHGFDAIGSRYNEVGNLVSWWSKSSKEKFQEKSQCLVDQYSSFFYETAGMFVNGNLTLIENIADHGGLKAAFGGYQLWKDENPDLEFKLPGFEKFTPEQLFLIANAQMWCATEGPEVARRSVMTNYHSPSVFRVEGMYKNFKEFGEAFGCKREDAPYPKPENMCRIW